MMITNLFVCIVTDIWSHK